MLPVDEWNDGLNPQFEEVIGPSKNYRLFNDLERIAGFVDDLKAMEQAIFMLLSVERYQYKIYSWNVGVEFNDLIGENPSYAASEAKRRITEALLQDDRIESVDSFEVNINKNNLHITFVAQTIFGDVQGNREVEI